MVRKVSSARRRSSSAAIFSASTPEIPVKVRTLDIFTALPPDCLSELKKSGLVLKVHYASALFTGRALEIADNLCWLVECGGLVFGLSPPPSID